MLDDAAAARLARFILPSLHREYPNKLAHVLTGDGDARPPRLLTPAFYGCFDWHSAVHGHWAVARLLPRLAGADAAAARAALDRTLTAANIAGELDYLAAPERAGFELPYGMAWLLTLAAELGDTPWRRALAPLEAEAAARLADHFDRLPGPIRTGEHNQTAFAMGLAVDARPDLGELIAARARAFYLADRAAPLHLEPSAHDFLSPALAEADLMRRVLAPADFAAWFEGFLPAMNLAPVAPADRSDGKLVHFDGLNLSRAWMLRAVAVALPEPRRAALRALADAHGAAGLIGVNADHYAGAHWLGSYAVYWLTPAP